MNESSFITFLMYMLKQTVIPFWKELFVAFKMTPNIKKHSLFFSGYRPLYKGRSSILKFFYEGCSNMNASSFITFFTCMLQQNGKLFYKGQYVTFKLVPNRKKNTVYLSSHSPLNEGHVSIVTNSMLRTYTSDIDERIILR